MAEVKAVIAHQYYRTEITAAGGSTLVADEPVAHGGQNAGMSPEELLAASLAACTSITLRMYADRKQYKLEHLEVQVTTQRDAERNFTAINRHIALYGPLAQDERDRLLEIANKCPVHKILSNQINITTTLI